VQQATLQDANIPTWSPRDQQLLVAGIITFGVSSVMRLILVLTRASALASAAANEPVWACPPPLSDSRWNDGPDTCIRHVAWG